MSQFKTTTWSNSSERGNGLFVWARRTLSPLLLIVLCPPAAILMWHTCVNLNGSVVELGQAFTQNGILATIIDIWSPVFWGTSELLRKKKGWQSLPKNEW